MPQTAEWTTVVKRVELLERQNHTLKLVGTLLLCSVGGAFLMGTIHPRDRTVEAEKFILRDRDGRVRASLDMEHDGPGLALYDQKGAVRAQLGVFPDGSPALGLSDAQGQAGATLNLSAGRWPHLEFYNGHGDVRVTLGLNYDDKAFLHIYDREQKKFWAAP